MASQHDESYLGRVVRILESFSPVHPVRSVADIAAHTGIPVPTTYRYVADLIRVGLLERGTSGERIQQSVRLWELGYRASSVAQIRRVALPLMQDLQSVIGHNTQLSVLDGTDVLYIERLSARGAVSNITQTGERMPAKINSSGLLLASFEEPDRIDEILAADISDYWLVATPPPSAAVHLPTRAELEAIVERARRDGYCRLDAWLSHHTSGISAPIRDATGQVRAALSLIVPNERSIPQRTLPALRTSAIAVSRALGWPGPRDRARRTSPDRPLRRQPGDSERQRMGAVVPG